MVERQRDAVVAAVGEQRERVVEPVVGEPVRDVARSAGSRDGPPARRAVRASGQSAATRDRPAPSAPDAGEQAGLERDQPEDPGADARCMALAATGLARRLGVRAAATLDAYAPSEAERGGAPARVRPGARGDAARGRGDGAAAASARAAAAASRPDLAAARRS